MLRPTFPASARLLLLLAGCLLACGQALAWGELGHRTIAALAEQALAPTARASVEDLLRGHDEPTLAGVAAWPDRIRDQPQWRHTGRWHYLNFPHQGGCDYSPARDCPDADCVVGAINRQLAILADRAQPRAERATALSFVVHFVGDVHQPLHAGFAHDKGGNDFQVSIALPGQPAEGSNLHSTWDRWLLVTRETDWRTYAQLLGSEGIPTSERDQVGGNRAGRWAQESCRIVREPDFYPEVRKIGTEYLDRWRPSAEKRMREAAGRLATLLNDALG